MDEDAVSDHEVVEACLNVPVTFVLRGSEELLLHLSERCAAPTAPPELDLNFKRPGEESSDQLVAQRSPLHYDRAARLRGAPPALDEPSTERR